MRRIIVNRKKNSVSEKSRNVVSHQHRVNLFQARRAFIKSIYHGYYRANAFIVSVIADIMYRDVYDLFGGCAVISMECKLITLCNVFCVLRAWLVVLHRAKPLVGFVHCYLFCFGQNSWFASC